MLKNLGVRIEHALNDGFPPVRVIARRPARRDRAVRQRDVEPVPLRRPHGRAVRAERSARRPRRPADELAVRRDDDAADGRVRRHAGADPRPADRRAEADHRPAQAYAPTNYAIEPDASNATYFLAAAAIHPGSKVTIEGLGKRSLQGDVGFADVLHRMGADLVFGKDFITIKGTETLRGHRRRPVRHARHGADARGRCALRGRADDDPRPAHAAREGDRPPRGPRDTS